MSSAIIVSPVFPGPPAFENSNYERVNVDSVYSMQQYPQLAQKQISKGKGRGVGVPRRGYIIGSRRMQLPLGARPPNSRPTKVTMAIVKRTARGSTQKRTMMTPGRGQPEYWPRMQFVPALSHYPFDPSTGILDQFEAAQFGGYENVTLVPVKVEQADSMVKIEPNMCPMESSVLSEAHLEGDGLMGEMEPMYLDSLWEECHREHSKFAMLGWTLDPASNTWYDRTICMFYNPINNMFNNREGVHFAFDYEKQILVEASPNGEQIPDGKKHAIPEAVVYANNNDSSTSGTPYYDVHCMSAEQVVMEHGVLPADHMQAQMESQIDCNQLQYYPSAMCIPADPNMPMEAMAMDSSVALDTMVMEQSMSMDSSMMMIGQQSASDCYAQASMATAFAGSEGAELFELDAISTSSSNPPSLSAGYM